MARPFYIEYKKLSYQDIILIRQFFYSVFIILLK